MLDVNNMGFHRSHGMYGEPKVCKERTSKVLVCSYRASSEKNETARHVTTFLLFNLFCMNYNWASAVVDQSILRY